MNEYKVAVTWTSYGEHTILADNLKDAMKKAKDLPLPKTWDYVDESLVIDTYTTLEVNEEEIERCCATCRSLDRDRDVCCNPLDPCLDENGKCGLWEFEED